MTIPKTVMMPIGKIKPNPKNPRIVKRKEFKKLVDRIRKFPMMLNYRPIVIDKKKMIIGGTQRYKAAVELGYKTVPVLDASKFTPTEVKQFMLWDNDNAGTWDFAELENWKDLFGVEVVGTDKSKFDSENCEIPIVQIYDEKYFAVMIVVQTEMDFANLTTVLEMGKEKNYKGSSVKQTQVIAYERFIELYEKWKKSK